MTDTPTSEIANLHKFWQAKREEAEGGLAAVKQLADLMGVPLEASTNGNGHHQQVAEPLQLAGLSVPEALVAYARANGNILKCNPASQALMAAGVGSYHSLGAAYSSFYGYLKKDRRWTKIGPGEFQLADSAPALKGVASVGNGYQAQPMSSTNRALAPLAVGRDHSVCELPVQFRNFDLKSLQGMNYRDAAVALARHAGGVISAKDLSKVFWHADLCGRARQPGIIGGYIWPSALSPKAGVFKPIHGQKGVYKLIV